MLRRGGALPASPLSLGRDPHRLLAPVLQAISIRGDLAKTLLWLVLRIPATHWYKGDTASRRWYAAQRCGGCVNAPARANHHVGVVLSLGPTTLAKIRTREFLSMNKTDLINAIAEKAELTKADAGRALEAFFETVQKSLKKGEDVSVVGFGTFTVRKRAARTGRNPRTNEAIKIKASKVPAFKAGKTLKDALN
jgi:DNA-binding protein HU-beta